MTNPRPLSMSRLSHLASIALAALLASAGSGCGPGDPPANYFFFGLDEGTPVDLRLTAVEAAPDTSISMKIGDVLLDEPGDTALIGVAVEALHTHPEWLATVPGGSAAGGFTFSLSFELTTTASAYQASDTYTASFALVDEGPDEPEETEILIGSTLDGGGELATRYDFDEPIPLYFDQCIGGSGDDCAGGVVVYSSSNPGFAPQE
jgi:hypothetical protein